MKIIRESYLLKTESLCPKCLKKIDAYYIGEDDLVYLVKDCNEHGSYKTLVWEGVDHWLIMR